MDDNVARYACVPLLMAVCFLTTGATAENATAEQPPPAFRGFADPRTWRNDLDGTLRGQVDFAQTHVIAAQRRIFDPLLVPEKDALVMFTPADSDSFSAVNMVVEGAPQGDLDIPMAPPTRLPAAARYDESNTFSGTPIVGNYVMPLRTFSATLPWNVFGPTVRIHFYANNNPGSVGTLNSDKLIFMSPESEGVVLMNIKGCIFIEQNKCRTTVDQFDMEKNPELAKIAAREMLSELPTQRLVLGMGQAYWPYIIAKGPDGKPHRYSLSDRDYHEWSDYGDKTIAAKVGMGSYWRAASELGAKAPGQYVAVSGQLMDAPDDVPLLPPGVGASCGAYSCNYARQPDGYWHETGHGLGLPHDTPPRYEDWAYRAYDLKLLPNYHPDPLRYGLGLDYLGYHYFGHVLGALGEPAWPVATASAPLVDEFESLRMNNRQATTDWKRYIAPYTHQQTLRLQQTFGRFPDGLQYAALTDDHRPPPGSRVGVVGVQAGQPKESLIDKGIDDRPPLQADELLQLISPGQTPVLSGVPVYTLVVTLSDAKNDAEKISQIYPPIISNYGNVFTPPPMRSLVTGEHPDASIADDIKIQSLKTGRCLTRLSTGTVGLETCEPMRPEQSWNQVSDEFFHLSSGSDGVCLDSDLRLSACSSELTHSWSFRHDLTGGPPVARLQDMKNGMFITPDSQGGVGMAAYSGDDQNYLVLDASDSSSGIELEVRYNDGSLDTWNIYPGSLPPDSLRAVAINIASARNPVSAELKRGSKSIDKRTLDIQPDPVPAVSVGAEFGYPVINLRFLRSESTGLCLTRAGAGLTQKNCDLRSADQRWGIAETLSASGAVFSLTGLSTASCLLNTLALVNPCLINQSVAQWDRRPDLAHPGFIMLQNVNTSLFITAAANQSVSSQPLSRGADQNFRSMGIENFTGLERIVSVATQKCIARVGQRVVQQTCSADVAQQWRAATTESPETGGEPYLAILTGDGGRCLQTGLILASCDPRTASQRWAGRWDLTNGRDYKLQNAATETFVTSNEDGSLSQTAPTSNANQLYQLIDYVQPQGVVANDLPH